MAGKQSCPRCGGMLNMTVDYPTCMQCGDEDYTRPLRRDQVRAEEWAKRQVEELAEVKRLKARRA